MKKLERLCCVLMMFLTLIGCSSSTPQTHDVIFQDSIRIDLGDDDVNTAEYVKRIDSYPISGSSIDGNKIHVSNITMVCPSLKKGDLEKLGKQELIYTIGDEKYTVEANIVDSVKPVINVKDDSLTFEVGEMKGINNYYSVSDNYDASKDIKIKVKNIDKLNKNKTGTYKLVIKAWDTSGNTASKKLTVIIKDTKKEQEEKQKEEGTKQIAVLNPQLYVELAGKNYDKVDGGYFTTNNANGEKIIVALRGVSKMMYLIGFREAASNNALYCDQSMTVKFNAQGDIVDFGNRPIMFLPDNGKLNISYVYTGDLSINDYKLDINADYVDQLMKNSKKAFIKSKIFK